jgi:hypothetical protein
VTYTEEEIRRAWGRTASNWNQNQVNLLIAELEKKDHRHDLADSDTVTAKEVRAAWDRLDALQGPGSVTSGQLLRDISEHREPEYPVKTIWKDADGSIWVRLPGMRWGRLAQLNISPDNAPKRPLRRMDVLP